MEHILEEIRATFDCGIWYPTISSLLSIPDACGAVEFWGQALKPSARYVQWYNKWVLPNFRAEVINFDGSVVYVIRNALIHESTGFTRGKHGFDRIIFMPPTRGIGRMEFNLSDKSDVGGDAAFQVTISGFLDAIEQGVYGWLEEVRNDEDTNRLQALDKLVQYRPEGQAPHFVGVPVIS